MTGPLVHLNGTSKGELLRLREEACNALNVALERMQEATPNARDYYPLTDPQAWTKASDVHRERCLRVRKVMNEIEAEMEEIDTQGK